MYKITVPSAKNDVYPTGRFNFGSVHRPVDGVDICRELYDHAGSSTLLPDDPFFSMRSLSGVRQVLTYAVMRRAVKAGAMRLGVDPTKFSLHSLRIGGGVCVTGGGGTLVNDIVYGAMEVGTGVSILWSTIGQWTTCGRLVCYPLLTWSYCIRVSPSR